MSAAIEYDDDYALLICFKCGDWEDSNGHWHGADEPYYKCRFTSTTECPDCRRE